MIEINKDPITIVSVVGSPAQYSIFLGFNVLCYKKHNSQKGNFTRHTVSAVMRPMWGMTVKFIKNDF